MTINTLGTNTRTGVAAPGGSGTRFNRWRPNSSVTTGLVGYEGVGALNRDTFDPQMLNQSLISPVKTHTAYFQGGFDLNALGDAELYYEFLGNHRKSTQTGYRQLTLDYAVGNPLIPANLRDSVAGPATDQTNGVPMGVRAFIGFGNDQSKQKVDFLRFNAGLRGHLSSEWNYDFNIMHSRSDADYTFQSFLTSRLAQSLDVVSNGAGGFVCRDASNGCVAAPGEQQHDRRPSAAGLEGLGVRPGHRQHAVQGNHGQLQRQRPAVRHALWFGRWRVRCGVPQGPHRRQPVAVLH